MSEVPVRYSADKDLVPLTQEEMAAAQEARPDLGLPAVTYKADIWRRATDQEAEAIEAGMAAQPIRLRNIFRDAQHLSHGDEMFGMLMGLFTQAFGEVRAKELLAPS